MPCYADDSTSSPLRLAGYVDLCLLHSPLMPKAQRLAMGSTSSISDGGKRGGGEGRGSSCSAGSDGMSL